MRKELISHGGKLDGSIPPQEREEWKKC